MVGDIEGSKVGMDDGDRVGDRVVGEIEGIEVVGLKEGVSDEGLIVGNPDEGEHVGEAIGVTVVDGVKK